MHPRDEEAGKDMSALLQNASVSEGGKETSGEKGKGQLPERRVPIF